MRSNPALKRRRFALAAWPLLALGGLALACGVQGGSTTGTGGSTGSGAGATGSGGATSGGGATGTGGGAGGQGGSSGSTGTGGAATGGVTGAGGTGASGGNSGGAGSMGTGGASAGGAGGQVLSGVTVDIGGTTYPKENVIAFVNFGHSNMAGRGVTPTALRPYFFTDTDPHAWMYHSGRGFEPSLEPKTAGDGGNTVNGMVSGGLSTALVKGAVALNPNKIFVTVPFGAGKAYCSQYCPVSGPCSGGLYYNSAMNGAKEIKDKVTWGGIVLLLGITERHGTQADIDGYTACIKRLVTSVRADLGQPNLPLLINDYEMGTTGPLAPVPSDTFFVAIRPKILAIDCNKPSPDPSCTPNAVVIPTDNPIIPIQDDTSTTDDHHFDLEGHKEYASRVLAKMMTMGWAPWLSP